MSPCTFPGCLFDFPASRPPTALADLDLAALIANADATETHRAPDWLEQQALRLHALLLADEERPTAQYDRRQTPAPVGNSRSAGIKRPKLVQM
jgi:hypothetical protein